MTLSEYFEETKGTGILATANDSGELDVAIYARPHFEDEETIAFIMADRLSHANLQTNPKAAYMFIEEGKGYGGKRLYLSRIREESDQDKIKALRRRSVPADCAADSPPRYLVYFHIDRIRPAVGDD